MDLGEIDPFFKLVADEWRNADVDGDGSLDRKEISTLLNRLNITVKKKQQKKQFNEVDVDKSGTLNFTEFMVFLSNLRNRPELNAVFAEYSGGSDHMTVKQFHKFLSEEQLELSMSEADTLGLIHELEGSDTARFLYLSGFVNYLTSERYNSWKTPRAGRVSDNMDQPLAHYFIASSHNTYCTGDQLKGASSVEMYEYVLKKGCRCVELDCWDGPQGEPLIYHGRTLTSKIKFRDVVETIRDHAFSVSDFPVILSIENHCSYDQQIAMAEIMVEVFGDMLPPPFVSSRALPSPKDMRRKILLKGKTHIDPIRFSDEEMGSDYDSDLEEFGGGADSAAEQEEEEEEEEEAGETDDEAGSPSASGSPKAHDRIAIEGDSESDSGVVDSGVESGAGSGKVRSRSVLGSIGSLTRRMSSKSVAAMKGAKKAMTPTGSKDKTSKIAEELSSLIHFKTVHFGGFESMAEADARTMSSFSENKIAKLIKAQPAALVKYSQKQLARVYPKGTRFDSSNYDPYPGWCVGAQLVALNFQTTGSKMEAHAGFFNTNGGCGYRLKPYFMRSPFLDWHPGLELEHLMTLNLTVISAWQLPFVSGSAETVIDPYAVINIAGVPQDAASTKTKVVKNNGMNPVFNYESTFKICVPDLAVLHIRIFDSDRFSADDFIAYAALPVTALNSGYRHVPLLSYKDVPLTMSSLFVRIHIT